jgi:hypothetical protein
VAGWSVVTRRLHEFMQGFAFRNNCDELAFGPEEFEKHLQQLDQVPSEISCVPIR